MHLRCTLVLNQGNLTSTLERLLVASNTCGYHVWSHGDVADLYCAKAVYTGESLPVALAKSSVHVALAPEDVGSVEDPYDLEQKAALFRNQLLARRLGNHHQSTEIVDFSSAGLAPQMQAVGKVLAVAVGDDCELQKGVVALLSGQDENLRQEQATAVAAVVVEGCLFFCHERELGSSVRSGEIAQAAGAILKGRQDSRSISPEDAGRALNGILGLHTSRLAGGVGKGLVLDQETHTRVHHLGHVYGVPAAAKPYPGCKFCLGTGQSE